MGGNGKEGWGQGERGTPKARACVSGTGGQSKRGVQEVEGYRRRGGSAQGEVCSSAEHSNSERVRTWQASWQMVGREQREGCRRESRQEGMKDERLDHKHTAFICVHTHTSTRTRGDTHTHTCTHAHTYTHAHARTTHARTTHAPRRHYAGTTHAPRTHACAHARTHHLTPAHLRSSRPPPLATGAACHHLAHTHNFTHLHMQA